MELSGVLIVNKSEGMTSHDVVNRIRRLYGTRRVGHTGTLDPLATGVLVVLVGRAAKAAEYLTADSKEYIATLRLGITTDTEDITGTVLTRADPTVMPTTEQVRAILPSFTGEIMQVPPMYSAVKINGVPCYKLARKGQEVERKARHVNVLSYNITRIDLAAAEVDFTVHCSKGFYVRTYAHDIGQHLGCGAHLTALRRIRSGHFDIAQAVDVPTLKAAGRDELLSRLLPLEQVLADRNMP